MSTTATIDQLRPGSEYPGGNINSRTYNDQDIESRAESLMTFGQLQSLTVCPAPGKEGPPYYVAAGGLRRDAFDLLVKNGRLPKTHPIDITLRPDFDSAMALAASIEENRERTPLHPVNEYEQFAELAKRNKTPADIAAMYGMPEREVLGVLALGNLHPDIRAAWRDGKIKAEIAKAYTISTDQKRQIAVFKKLDHNRWLQPSTVRHSLVGNTSEVGHLVSYVGKSSYEKAGGKVMVDLFGENHCVSDAALLKNMADMKLEVHRNQLLADGWSWVAAPDELASNWQYNWESIEVKPKLDDAEKNRVDEITKRLEEVLRTNDEDGMSLDDDEDTEFNALETEERLIKATAALRAFKPDQKKRSGVVLWLDSDGVQMKPGIIKPADVKKTPTKELDVDHRQKAKSKKALMGLSNALAQRLSEVLTIATAKALAKEPEVAIPALIAGFATNIDCPVKVNEDGLDAGQRRIRKTTPFFASFERMRKAPIAKQNEALSAIAADALSFRVFNAARKPLCDKNIVAICSALDSKSLNAELRAAFKAEDYFAGISSDMRVQAIREACGEDNAARAAKLKKAEQTKFAVKNVPQTGWLPPEFRTSHYDGPSPARKTLTKRAKRK